MPDDHQQDGDEVSAFHASVDDGLNRLTRTVPSLLATGLIGGLDVTIGVFMLLIVEADTGSKLLGALAFSFGFVALTLANSELFTENFLVPVAAVAARKATGWQLVRLWLGTLSANLVGGFVGVGLVMLGFPDLRATALEVGGHFPALGIGASSLANAIVGGVAITLMTWMERGTRSVPAKLAAAIGTGFLLAAGGLLHAIVASLEMFAALQVGAPFGYLDWAGMAAWAILGNMIGGIGFVTMLRLVQVGKGEIDAVSGTGDGRTRDDGRTPEVSRR